MWNIKINNNIGLVSQIIPNKTYREPFALVFAFWIEDQNIKKYVLLTISSKAIVSCCHQFPPNLMELKLTPQQLLAYNGSDRSKPLYVALKGRIYDVTKSILLYGPGGSYSMFAGKDASRALAKMSKNVLDITSSLVGLSEKEISVLNDWEKKFQAKYPIVGRVV